MIGSNTLIAFNKNLLMNVPHDTIVNKAVLKNNRLQYLKSYNSISYLNLDKYGIVKGIIPLSVFKLLLKDNNYFKLNNVNQTVQGINLAYLEYLPQISQLYGIEYIGYNIQEFQMLQNYTYHYAVEAKRSIKLLINI